MTKKRRISLEARKVKDSRKMRTGFRIVRSSLAALGFLMVIVTATPWFTFGRDGLPAHWMAPPETS